MNFNLNEISGIRLTGEYNKFYPRVLNIELCDYCNFYCGHCYKNAHRKNKQFLDRNNFKYNLGFMINRTYLEESKEYNKFINSLNYNKIIFSFAELQVD
ncbi:hypothetical protein ABGF26_03155 [Helcococcus ovis]|uniref:hypothetical protein n=1 Tax=Helcococcus ovis TaxID=72026 RepID=UPI0038BBE292